VEDIFPSRRTWCVIRLGVHLKVKKNPRKGAWMSKFWIVLFFLCNSGFGFFVGVVEKDVKELICGNPLFTYSLAALLTV
jgi:hypothetical protein